MSSADGSGPAAGTSGQNDAPPATTPPVRVPLFTSSQADWAASVKPVAAAPAGAGAGVVAADHHHHDGCCDHTHISFGQSGDLLSSSEKRALGTRLLLALISAGLLLMSLIIHLALPAQAELGNLVAGVAAVLVAIPVLMEAWSSLRRPSLHGVTDQLVAVALIAAWVVGDLETAALVPLAMVIGHVLEERSLIGSREAIAALGRLAATHARRIAADGTVNEVPVDSLATGMRVEVRPGDRCPADGIVRDGSSSIDTAPITGESVPVEVTTGDTVFAGTINQNGRLVVEVTRTGSETALGKVVSLLHEAEQAKPPVTRLLERYAQPYLVAVLLAACATWFLTGSVAAMMAVLVASCPCALVLAAPATAIAALAVAGRHGILVKGTAFLEELAEVDALILDKTGTVTLGRLALTGTQPAAGVEAAELSRIAGSLGAASSHPVSRAVSGALPAEQRLTLTNVRETGGKGLTGVLPDGRTVIMGRASFLSENAVTVPPAPAHDGPLVGVAVAGSFYGWLLLADEPRPEAARALTDLRGLGLTRQVMVTGDRRAVAESVAARLGIDTVEAEVLPQQKLDRVLAEISAGRHPLVVGDGVNDALALKAGAVGVAIGGLTADGRGGGTDVAMASSDLVLMSSDLRRLGTCVRLSRLCRRTINLNVLIGLGWTLLIIAGAAIGWYGPVAAVLLHNLGTLAVMVNAGRLLRFDETGR
jgi:heavy metal translocating P-type ATPase